jgi:hypothetical protein
MKRTYTVARSKRPADTRPSRNLFSIQMSLSFSNSWSKSLFVEYMHVSSCVSDTSLLRLLLLPMPSHKQAYIYTKTHIPVCVYCDESERTSDMALAFARLYNYWRIICCNEHVRNTIPAQKQEHLCLSMYGKRLCRLSRQTYPRQHMWVRVHAFMHDKRLCHPSRQTHTRYHTCVRLPVHASEYVCPRPLWSANTQAG